MEGASLQHAGGPPAFDFERAPFIVIWETTQACDLACRHCRAEAVPQRHPDELTTAQAKRMLDEVRRFGPIVFVFSGGDCMKRPDLMELVEYGVKLGLRIAITPAATPLVTPEVLRRFKEAGVARLAVSLDGSCPAIHDDFRRVPGSFDWAVDILKEAQRAGLPTQVNTVVSRHNLADFDALCDLMGPLGIVFWEVFFLVPTGRARPEDVAGADAFEAVFHKLHDLAETAPFQIRATAAPHYARVGIQRRVAARRSANGGGPKPVVPTFNAPEPAPADRIGRARGVTEGDGFMFISHTGEVYPSGFLPHSGGNIAQVSPVEIYRNAPLFVQLRDRTQLKGKCGICEYRQVCGGSRARAYAVTGDWLAAEPFCAHEPVPRQN
ncbi:MAG TPA: TIGR04053 family radical SAM/SPASM domain-containing protein [Longimicrobiales bacterium]